MGAILALLYRSEVQETLKDNMESQVKNDYIVNDPAYDAWNYLQVKVSHSLSKTYFINFLNQNMI